MRNESRNLLMMGVTLRAAEHNMRGSASCRSKLGQLTGGCLCKGSHNGVAKVRSIGSVPMVFEKGRTMRINSRLEWYHLASLSSNGYTVNNQA